MLRSGHPAPPKSSRTNSQVSKNGYLVKFPLGYLIHVSDQRLFVSKIRWSRKFAGHGRAGSSLSDTTLWAWCDVASLAADQAVTHRSPTRRARPSRVASKEGAQINQFGHSAEGRLAGEVAVCQAAVSTVAVVSRSRDPDAAADDRLARVGVPPLLPDDVPRSHGCVNPRDTDAGIESLRDTSRSSLMRSWSTVGDAQRQTWNGLVPGSVWTVQEPSLRKLAAVA